MAASSGLHRLGSQLVQVRSGGYMGRATREIGASGVQGEACMRVLFVTPQQISSGEIITALHMAEQLVARGDAVLFLASGFARRFIEQQFPQALRDLTDDGAANRARWAAALHEFAPDLIVFADYPLLFFSSGVAPLADESWVRSLDEVEAVLVT